MRFVFTFLILLCCGSLTHSQEVTVSPPQKVTNKAPRFRIIGKNAEGLILRRYGKDITYLDRYGADMKLKFSKPINLRGSNTHLVSIQMLKNGITIFYLNQLKNQSILLARKLDQKFDPIGKDVALDTLEGSREMITQNLRFKVAQNKQRFMCYLPEYKSGKIASVRVTTFDLGLRSVRSKKIGPFDEAKVYKIKRSQVDNEGNSYFLFSEQSDSKRKEQNLDALQLFEIDLSVDRIRRFPVPSDKQIFGDILLQYDNLNKKLIVSGFYSESDGRARNAAHGFFYHMFDSEGDIFEQSRFHDFDNEFIHKLTGRDTLKRDNKLFTFGIEKIQMRRDGGALLIAESFYKDAQDVRAPNMMNSSFPSYRSVAVYHYNDVAIFSMNPDGNIDWQAIMRKKQISEDDAGAFSSFCMMNARSELRFLYLDDIFYGGTFNEYTLDSKGELERRSMFNLDDYDVMLIPKQAVQVGPNELIIPSYKKNMLKLLKIKY